MTPGLDARIDALSRRFNEPAIPEPSIRKWLGQFEEEDRPAALLLLEQITFHTYPALIGESRLLHGKLKAALSAAGFDGDGLRDVDFTREFTCKSGDIISYIYRKANLIPTADFKTVDRLVEASAQEEEGRGERALVILDDYIGTGSQFIFQFVARSPEDIRLIGSYKRVFLCCVAVHEKAIEKGFLLRHGRIEEVIRLEEEQIPDVDFAPDEKLFRESLRKVDWSRIELVRLHTDVSILSEENGSLDREQKRIVERFLNRYALKGCEGATSFLCGRHAFFYGAPNAVPAVLLPLFTRVEDFTVYPDEHYTGITSQIIDYEMGDGGTCTIVRI
ncbi:MAG: hypothetical protein IT574_06785 [Candidatus Aureabacteria bacterium]|jgi:hypothetical protein|nr:hypothetical protein [Candidatus Auribacterota bacterium]NLW94952.1 hypothetical protein [Chlamydiota bacterium]HOE26837.1 hypothetical protein [bacterium]HQM52826.1 hypothetical protein [bacterium]